MVSAIDRAKRALVKLLKQLAKGYDLQVDVVRESADSVVRSAYRKVSRRTHPDRGGDAQDQVALNNAYNAWEESLKQPWPSRGRPRHAGPTGDLVMESRQKPEFRFDSVGVLLTYQKFSDKSCWKRFLTFLKACLKDWSVRRWCATLETNKDAGSC